MPRQEQDSSGTQNAVQLFDRDAFLVHYRHLQKKRKRGIDTGPCCSRAPQFLIREVAPTVPETEMVQSDGVDEEGTGSFSPPDDRY